MRKRAIYLDDWMDSFLEWDAKLHKSNVSQAITFYLCIAFCLLHSKQTDTETWVTLREIIKRGKKLRKSKDKDIERTEINAYLHELRVEAQKLANIRRADLS